MSERCAKVNKMAFQCSSIWCFACREHSATDNASSIWHSKPISYQHSNGDCVSVCAASVSEWANLSVYVHLTYSNYWNASFDFGGENNRHFLYALCARSMMSIQIYQMKRLRIEEYFSNFISHHTRGFHREKSCNKSLCVINKSTKYTKNKKGRNAYSYLYTHKKN